MVKNSSLVYCAYLILMFILVPQADTLQFGMTIDSPLHTRLTHMFIHYNFLHIALNIYAILTIVFLCDVSHKDLFVSAIASISTPVFCLSDKPVIGASIIAYALTGIVVMRSGRWKSLALFNLAVILFGAFLPNIAFLPHLWGFLFGVVYGILTAKRYGN